MKYSFMTLTTTCGHFHIPSNISGCHPWPRPCLRQPPLHKSWKASVIIAFGIGNCSQPWCHSQALSQLIECTLSYTRARGKVLGHKLRNLHLVEIVHDPLSTPQVVNPLVLCFFALFFSHYLEYSLTILATASPCLSTFILVSQLIMGSNKLPT